MTGRRCRSEIQLQTSGLSTVHPRPAGTNSALSAVKSRNMRESYGVVSTLGRMKEPGGGKLCECVCACALSEDLIGVL